MIKKLDTLLSEPKPSFLPPGIVGNALLQNQKLVITSIASFVLEQIKMLPYSKPNYNIGSLLYLGFIPKLALLLLGSFRA